MAPQSSALDWKLRDRKSPPKNISEPWQAAPLVPAPQTSAALTPATFESSASQMHKDMRLPFPDPVASQARRYRVPGQPLLNRHQVGGVSRSPDGLFAQQEREPIRGRPAARGGKGQMVDGWDSVWRNRAPGPHRNTETQRGRLRTAYGQRRVDSKSSQTTPATTSTSSIRQLLGAADTQTAHHATFSTAPTHQLLGSANAQTTPAGAPAAAADRTQRPDATCEGKNG